MPKCKRIVIPGFPHHITHRGNLGQDIFFLDSDRRLYLGLLEEHTKRHQVTVQAYCLMSNHVHLIATPQDSDGLHQAIERAHGDYARALHIRLKRRGHLWQGRFHSSPMDEDHFWAGMVYVERNPVRAGLVKFAATWPWSSASTRLEGRAGDFLDLTQWRTSYTAERWRECLAFGLGDASLLERIRQATHKGRPAAAETFLKELELQLGTRLTPARGGRPRKAAAA